MARVVGGRRLRSARKTPDLLICKSGALSKREAKVGEASRTAQGAPTRAAGEARKRTASPGVTDFRMERLPFSYTQDSLRFVREQGCSSVKLKAIPFHEVYVRETERLPPGARKMYESYRTPCGDLGNFIIGPRPRYAHSISR